MHPHLRQKFSLSLRLVDLALDLTLLYWLILGNMLVFGEMEKESNEIKGVVYFVVLIGYIDILRWSLIFVFTLILLVCLACKIQPRFLSRIVGPILRRNRKLGQRGASRRTIDKLRIQNYYEVCQGHKDEMQQLLNHRGPELPAIPSTVTLLS